MTARRYSLFAHFVSGLAVATTVVACGSDGTATEATGTSTASIDAVKTTPVGATTSRFELSGGNLQVTYGTVDGVPTLTYQDAVGTRVFEGNELHTDVTAVGTMVSVVTEENNNLDWTSFTLFVPRMQMPPTQVASRFSMPVQTQGLTISHLSGGGNLLHGSETGQIDAYTVTPLQGVFALPLPVPVR